MKQKLIDRKKVVAFPTQYLVDSKYNINQIKLIIDPKIQKHYNLIFYAENMIVNKTDFKLLYFY